MIFEVQNMGGEIFIFNPRSDRSTYQLLIACVVGYLVV